MFQAINVPFLFTSTSSLRPMPEGVGVSIPRLWDFPGGSAVKNPPANAGDVDSTPDPGRSYLPKSG